MILNNKNGAVSDRLKQALLKEKIAIYNNSLNPKSIINPKRSRVFPKRKEKAAQVSQAEEEARKKPKTSVPSLIQEKIQEKKKKFILEVIGQSDGIKNIKRYLSNFPLKVGNLEPKNFSPIVLLYGKPGIGKTTACQFISKDLGYDLIEVNVSETRSYDEIYDYLCKSGFGKTIKSNKTAILFDEIDGAYSGERNAIRAIIDFLEKYKNVSNRSPIFCTCNEAHISLLKPLLPYCQKIQFHKLYYSDMKIIGLRLIRELGIKISNETLFQLAKICDGDARYFKNMLSLYKFLPISDRESKDQNTNIFDITKEFMLQKNLDHDKEEILLDRFSCSGRLGLGLVQNNYAQMSSHMDDVFFMAEALSLGDYIGNGFSEEQKSLATNLVRATCRSLSFNSQDMLNMAHNYYFQPMSKKIMKKRYISKYKLPDIMDCLYAESCLFVS